MCYECKAASDCITLNTTIMEVIDFTLLLGFIPHYQAKAVVIPFCFNARNYNCC